MPAFRRRAIIRDPVTATKPIPDILPVLSLLLAATMWGVIWYPLRLIEAMGLAGLWITVASYSAALLAGAVILLRRLDELKRKPLTLLFMALAAGWCNVSFILAILEGSVVRVLLLFYLSPLWTVVLGRFLLHERLSMRARLVFVMAFTGALIMLWDERVGMPLPTGRSDWLALSSGFAFALSNVLIRRLQSVSVQVKTEMSWAGVLFVALVLLAATSGLELPDAAGSAWLWAAMLGIFGIVIMTVSVQFGVTHMPVYRSAVILLFELIAGAVSAHLLADEHVLPREWLGGAMIVAGAWFAAHIPVETVEERTA